MTDSLTERPPPWAELSDSLGELAELMLGAEQPGDVLHRIATLATRTIASAASCSVSVPRDDGDAGTGVDVDTVAAANELSRQLDEMQYANGDGPCLEALREGTPVYAPALADETRWGQYPQLAVDHGVLSMLSLPLAPQGKTIGALNLYATVAGGFGEVGERALCDLFAGQAAVTMAGSRRHAAQLRLSAGLRGELDRLLELDRRRAERAAGRRRRLEALIEALSAPLTAAQVGQVVVDAATGGTTAGGTTAGGTTAGGTTAGGGDAACGALLTRTDHTPPAGRGTPDERLDGRLELLAARNLPDAARRRLDRLSLAHPPAEGDLLADLLADPLAPHPGPVVVPADELSVRDPDLTGAFDEAFDGRGVAAVAALPVRRGVDTVGVLVLAYPTGAGAGAEAGGGPDAEELGYLLTVARLAAAALERARLFVVEQASARRLALLARASAALVGSVTRNRALPALTQAFVPDLADWAAVHLVEPDGTLRLADVRAADPHRRGELRAVLTMLDAATGDGATGDGFGIRRVAREQRPAHHPDVDDAVLATLIDDPELRGRVGALDVSSLVVLPLSAAGTTFGTVTLARGGDGGPHRGFDPADVTLAQEIAGRAAISLDNARLYAQARDAALTLQRSLLPAALPTVDGVATAARYLPGTAGLEAGGDFYDVIPLPRGRVGLAIGDVMGHGIAAAAVMGQLRAALRAYALEDHPPAALLTRLNTVVHALGTGTLTTCTYAVYDPASRRLRIATAGHLPVLLSGPGQPTRYLDLDPGLPLGVGDPELVDATLTLAPMTTLVLCTDGLVESREEPLGEGLARLAEAVAAVTLPPEQTCDHVLHELRPADPDHAHTHADDIALLVATTAPAG